MKNENSFHFVFRYSAGVLAYMLVYLITWFILHVTKNDKGSIGPNDAYKFRVRNVERCQSAKFGSCFRKMLIYLFIYFSSPLPYWDSQSAEFSQFYFTSY